jgi:hypothetical protein
MLPYHLYSRLTSNTNLAPSSVTKSTSSTAFATLGTIGFEGRFDYAAIGTVSNVASRLCDEAKPGQIIISPRAMKVENAVSLWASSS